MLIVTIFSKYNIRWNWRNFQWEYCDWSVYTWELLMCGYILPSVFPASRVSGHTVTFSILSLSFTVGLFHPPTILTASLVFSSCETLKTIMRTVFCRGWYQEFYDGKFKRKANTYRKTVWCIFFYVDVCFCVVLPYSNMQPSLPFCVSYLIP